MQSTLMELGVSIIMYMHRKKREEVKLNNGRALSMEE